jgi:signal transduction histidine kinase
LPWGLLEVVQATLVAGADAHDRDSFRTIKWAVTAVSLAVYLGILILRAAPPLLSAVTPGRPLRTGERATRRILNYARWFIGMRWIAVLTAATLIFVAVQIAGLLPGHLWIPLSLAVFALAGLNVAYTLLLRRGVVSERILLFQVHGDLVLLTVMLHYSGGIENPLSLLMVLHVIIGGIFLSRRKCLIVAGSATLLLTFMTVLEGFEVIHHYTLQIFPHGLGEATEHAALHPLFGASSVALQSALLFLTSFFVTNLAERLRHDERQLEDMTNRALAERQLLERALVTTNTGLRVLDTELRTEWANSRWKAWFSESLPEEAAPKLDGPESAAARTLRDGRTRVSEFVLGGRAAETGPETSPGPTVQVITAPLRDAEDQVGLVVELAQDVTEQRRIRAEMVRAGRLAAVGELAGQVAHEVNNPIAIISGKARLLLSDCREQMSPRMVEEIQKITDFADRVARIAQGLLSFSRPSGAPRRPVDLRLPVRRALAMVEQVAANHDVRLVDDLGGPLAPVLANGQEMEQVFLNLMLNAVDAMPDGGRLAVTARTVGARDGHSAVQVQVEDTGQGIPDEIRQRVFEPFFTTKEQARGTGLGLAICLGVVESHNGEIEVASRPGEGTRFTVTIPVAEERDE